MAVTRGMSGGGGKRRKQRKDGLSWEGADSTGGSVSVSFTTEDDTEDGESSREDRPNKRRPRAKAVASVSAKYTLAEMAFYAALPPEDRAEIDAAEDEVRDAGDASVPLRFRILQSRLGVDARVAALERLEESRNAFGDTSGKAAGYVNALTRIPVDKYYKLPVDASSSHDEIKGFLARTRERLDDAVYGLDEVKHQFMMTIARWVTNPNASGLVLGLQGPAGVGKTTLVKDGLSAALGIPCAFVPIGSANDTSFLEGHSYCYEGSSWGRIADALMTTRIMNPIICFDELDKVANNARGSEIFNVLIHLTDTSAHNSFCDKYFAGVPLDLSRCVFVFTYNNRSDIHPILRNRIQEIQVPDYDSAARFTIMRRHVIPRILADLRMPPGCEVTDDAIMCLVSNHGGSPGLRAIKHDAQLVLYSLNLSFLMAPLPQQNQQPITVTRSYVEDILRKKKLHRDFDGPPSTMYI